MFYHVVFKSVYVHIVMHAGAINGFVFLNK